MTKTPKVTLALSGFVDPGLKAVEDRLALVVRQFADSFDGVEIAFFSFQAEEYASLLNRQELHAPLSVFSNNTLHIAERLGHETTAGHIETIVSLANRLHHKGLINALSLHLDMAHLFPVIEHLADPELLLAWENTDALSAAGNTANEIKAALNEHPKWDIVFDLAHALEMEPSGQPTLREYAQLVPAEFSQIHFSYPANLYPEPLVGPDFSTSHSLLCLASEDQQTLVGNFLHSTKANAITLEGVIPPGEAGLNLLEQEISLLHRLLSNKEDS